MNAWKDPKDGLLSRTLQEHFGLSSFRPGQIEAVYATLSGSDSVVILPTGGGKSVCFQLPALTRTYGFTVVICPLLALAKDQVDKCDERGIYAECWNSEVPEQRKASIAKDIASDEPSLRLLYTTPESLRHPKLFNSLKEACNNNHLVSFAVDEAHTVSEWGHDFRPAYLELSVIKQEFPNIPVTALTASCTAKVKDDIISVLRLRSPVVIKGSFNRPNISYEVRHKELIGDGSDSAALEDLIRFIEERPNQCGIIYARLRGTCDWLASSLAARDLDVGCYHAGKSTDARARVQRDWSGGALNVVVATIAFGMGIDRADVRWVAHWNAPTSIEGFYQESGRAGRDGQHSLSVLYSSNADLQANHKMERGTRTGSVAEVAAYAQSASCRRKHILKFFGEDRGGCSPSCDQLCDFCNNPEAVRKALRRVEQRELEHGSKAAAVRARMLGIRVDPTEGDIAGSVNNNADGVGGPRADIVGVAWSRASAYSSTTTSPTQVRRDSLKPDSARDADPPVNKPTHIKVGFDTRTTLNEQPLSAAAVTARRPPTIKRPLSSSGGQSCVMEADATSGCSRPTANPQQMDAELVSPADNMGSCTGVGVLTSSSQQAGAAPASGALTDTAKVRQPQLKRARPGLVLPFKAPARLPTAQPGSSAAGSASHLVHVDLPATTSSGNQGQQPFVTLDNRISDEQQEGPRHLGLKPGTPSAAQTGLKQGLGVQGGTCTSGVLSSGQVPVMVGVLQFAKRRLPFKPPLRVSASTVTSNLSGS